MKTDKLLLSVRDTCEQISIGRTTFYMLVNAGIIPTIKLGGKRLVSKSALEQLIRDLGQDQCSDLEGAK